MPTTYLHRLWCKTCKDWILHKKAWKAVSPHKCKDCDAVHERILLSKIPKDKILEQRERYEESTKKDFNNMLSGIMSGIGDKPIDLFSEDWPEPIIVESDAGQKKIDEKIAEKRKKEYEQKNLERQKQREEALKYKNLGRNDICLCGTGKKYKKCCQPKIDKVIK